MSILVILTLPQLVLQQVTDKEGNSHIMGFKGAWKANNAFYQEQGLADQNALNKINELLLQGKNNSEALAQAMEGASKEFKNLAISSNYSTEELTKYVDGIQRAAQPVKYLGTLLKSSLKSFGLSAVQFVLL